MKYKCLVCNSTDNKCKSNISGVGICSKCTPDFLKGLENICRVCHEETRKEKMKDKDVCPRCWKTEKKLLKVGEADAMRRKYGEIF